MQVSGAGIGQTISSLLGKEGVTAFWKGILFAYGRELSYTSIKLGAYAPVRDMIGAGGSDAPFYLKFLAGAITGGVGSVVGNPFDVMKTLAQTNSGTSGGLSSLVTDMYNSQRWKLQSFSSMLNRDRGREDQKRKEEERRSFLTFHRFIKSNGGEK